MKQRLSSDKKLILVTDLVMPIFFYGTIIFTALFGLAYGVISAVLILPIIADNAVDIGVLFSGSIVRLFFGLFYFLISIFGIIRISKGMEPKKGINFPNLVFVFMLIDQFMSLIITYNAMHLEFSKSSLVTLSTFILLAALIIFISIFIKNSKAKLVLIFIGLLISFGVCIYEYSITKWLSSNWLQLILISMVLIYMIWLLIVNTKTLLRSSEELQ